MGGGEQIGRNILNFLRSIKVSTPSASPVFEDEMSKTYYEVFYWANWKNTTCKDNPCFAKRKEDNTVSLCIHWPLVSFSSICKENNLSLPS